MKIDVAIGRMNRIIFQTPETIALSNHLADIISISSNNSPRATGAWYRLTFGFQKPDSRAIQGRPYLTMKF